MDKYLIKHKIAFTNKDRNTQIGEVGDIMSFEEGDDVNVASLLRLGAIEPYIEPKAHKSKTGRLSNIEEVDDGN